MFNFIIGTASEHFQIYMNPVLILVDEVFANEQHAIFLAMAQT